MAASDLIPMGAPGSTAKNWRCSCGHVNDKLGYCQSGCGRSRFVSQQSDAFKRGFEDEIVGVSWLKNPYPENSVEARRWIDGKVEAIKSKRSQAQRDCESK